MLAQHLKTLRLQGDLLVLALPRGGVPVAMVVAEQLNATMDLILIRKLGYPFNPEYAMGAVAVGKTVIWNTHSERIPQQEKDRVLEREYQELQRRNALYRNNRPPPDMAGRTIIVIDDGIATGASLKAALAVIRASHPAQVIVAIPVAPKDVRAAIAPLCDEYICPLEPKNFEAVGLWYEEFSQVSDAEVVAAFA